MRLLFVDNMQLRRYGRLKMSTGIKLHYAALRNNWRSTMFSDRDLARYLAPLGMQAIGGYIANKKLIETAINFKPDLIFIGHCDYIKNWALRKIREELPAVRMAHINVDPLWLEWPKEQIRERMYSTDGIFVTTGGEALKQFCTGSNFVAFMPHPVESSMESLDNSQKTSFERDLFFCGKEMAGDDRNNFLRTVMHELDGRLRFDVFGMYGKPGIFGYKYEQVLTSSKMSLNLNRVEGWPLYTSNRLAHLMGNGLLAFVNDSGGLQRFFSDAQAVFWHRESDLCEKVLHYHNHDSERQRVAADGRVQYHKLFNGQRVLNYMVEALTASAWSDAYEWRDHVFR